MLAELPHTKFRYLKGVLLLNSIAAASEEARALILDALGRLVADGTFPAEPLPAFNIEIPADRSHGDYASNVAMASAKTLHMAPRKIAEAIQEAMILDGTPFEKTEIAGPGFLNFYLGQKWYSDVLRNITEEGKTYGSSHIGSGQRVLVEFVSANPTGPMHVGNARGGAIGDSLASVLQAAGYETEREFYINDAGNQIEKFATSLEVRYLQACGQDIDMPEDAYQGADITAHANAFFAENGDKFAGDDRKARRDALVSYALPKNIQGLKDDLAQYRIHYDTWFPESRLHADGSVAKIIQQLKDSGYTYEKDGALWFKAEELGADKDFVIVRSNGIPTYVVPDIAYHYNKLAVRQFDRAIDILGADHHGYVPRLKAALTALGIDASRMTAVLMQMVAVMRDGKPVKQSKRSGKALTLVTLLEDIPADAARFFFNLREANSHFEFDLDLAVEKSSSNPVYYVQYAHARICSLIRNLQEAGISVPNAAEASLDLLSTEEERVLIHELAMLPAEIETAARQLDPSRLTKYSVELAALFHRFYDACKVRDAETPALRDARLLLCASVNIVLGNVLGLLKVTAPEKM